jgi:hypothetical protein
LKSIFYTETNAIRAGFLENTDSLVAGAFPSLQGDTLAFQPFPIEELARNDARAFPASTPAAIVRNRERLGRVAAEWARAFPNSSVALETYAQTLELQGRLDGPDTTQAWAANYFRRARSIKADTSTRLTASLGEVRVLIKLGRYDSARRLADSLLANAKSTSGANAGLLAGAAALTGRPLLAAELASRAGADARFATTSGEELSLPPALKGSALGYLALASSQVPVDSMLAVDRRILSQIDATVSKKDRPAVVNATIAMPRALAFPAMGNTMTYQGAIGGSLLLQLQADLLRADTASAHRLLLKPFGTGRQVLASEVPLDLALRQAQMLLFLGDTAAGRQLIELSLSSLPASGLGLLGDNPHISIPQAAAVSLALALSADLAAYRGDPGTARQLAGDALSLIDQRSEPMQPLVERLRKFNETRLPPQ